MTAVRRKTWLPERAQEPTDVDGVLGGKARGERGAGRCNSDDRAALRIKEEKCSGPRVGAVKEPKRDRCAELQARDTVTWRFMFGSIEDKAQSDKADRPRAKENPGRRPGRLSQKQPPCVRVGKVKF